MKTERIEFTEDELKRIRRAVANTWDAIASDVLAGETPEEELDVVEVVLDANYLESYGRERAAVARFRLAPYDQMREIAKGALRL